MLFDMTDYGPNMDMTMDIYAIPGNNFTESNNKSKFLNAEEGFLRGNLEKGTYIPYKNYTFFELKPETEQEKMLLGIMAISFAINDLNLYLDLHPEDLENYELFKKYANELNELEMMYAKKYGPICVTETQGSNFNWIKNPWPWDKTGGSMYV